MKTITFLLLIALLLNSYAHENRFTLPIHKTQAPQNIDRKAISKQYQLVFFFAETCRYCHQFSPVVKDIADEYNLKLITYSFDGKGIAGFNKPLKVDQTVLNDYFTGISVACPLLAVKDIRGKITILSQGMTPKTRVIEKFTAVIAQNSKEDEEAKMLKQYFHSQLKHRASNA